MVNWEAVSAIGQVLGALAVVVSLIYLAAQVRQNTRVVRAATFQSVVETSLTFSTAIGAEGERALVWRALPRRKVAARGARCHLDAGIGEHVHGVTARDEPPRNAELRRHNAAAFPCRQQVAFGFRHRRDDTKVSQLGARLTVMCT